MTVVVAVKHGGKVILGTDGRVLVDDDILPTKRPKYIQFSSGTVVGFTCLGPAGEQLIRMNGKPWHCRTDRQVLDFTEAFYPPLRELDKDYTASLLMVTSTRRVWLINNLLEAEELDGFYAIGGGASHAMGYLHSAYRKESSLTAARQVVLEAMQAAGRFRTDCGEPYYTVVL